MFQVIAQCFVEHLGYAASNIFVHARDRIETVANLPLFLFEEKLERLYAEGSDDSLECLRRRELLSLFDLPDVTGRKPALFGELFLSQPKPFTASAKIIAKEGTYREH